MELAAVLRHNHSARFLLHESYSCGSSLLTESWITFTVFFVAAVDITFYVLYSGVKSTLYCSGNDKRRVSTFTVLYTVLWEMFVYVSLKVQRNSHFEADTITTPEIRCLFFLFSELRGFAVRIVCVAMFIFLPVYSLLVLFFGNLEYHYGWITSVGFLLGRTPTNVLAVLWICLLLTCSTYIRDMYTRLRRARLALLHQQGASSKARGEQVFFRLAFMSSCFYDVRAPDQQTFASKYISCSHQ